MTYPTIIAGLWAAFIAYWFVSSFSAKPSVRGRARGVAVRVVIAIAAWAAIRYRVGPGGSRHPIGPVGAVRGDVGVAICLIGIGLAIWARRRLGRNWGMPMTLRREPELVTTGPYAYVRHPIYTAMLIAMVGAAIVLGPVWLLFVVAFGLYFAYSAHQEEQGLSQVLPGYAEYMQRSKRIIPFFY